MMLEGIMNPNVSRHCFWIAAIFFVSIGLSANDEPSREVLINNNGKITGFSHQMQRDIRNYLEEILGTCKTTEVEKEPDVLPLNVRYANDSYIYVQYKQLRQLQAGKGSVGIIELLMPVPTDSFPAKILAKESTNIHVLTDCSAKTIRQRICTNWLHYWFDNQYSGKCRLGTL